MESDKDKMPGELERVIIKDETVVTCENSGCIYRGEMRFCYLDLHKGCPIHLDYIAKEG